MTSTHDFSSRVEAWRQARGWSQAALAKASGVSRAAISAIETGRLVPSTAAALKLARALGVSVETLFQLDSAASRADWAWSAPRPTTRAWQASVGGRRLLYPVEPTAAGTLPHDGVVRTEGVERTEVGGEAKAKAKAKADSTASRSVSAAANIEVDASRFVPSPGAFDPERTLVLAGCDPTMALLAQTVAARSGIRVLPLLRSSREALDLLARGLVHAAGFHLQGARGGGSPAAHDRLVRASVGAGAQIVHVTRWDAGVAVHPARHARAIEPLLRGGVHWVNREEGSGARACLDRLLESHRRPAGYDHVVRDHRAVAATVSSGWADAGICLRTVAEEAGLDFLPVQQEAYEICIAPGARDDARSVALLDAVRSLAYRRLLADVPGFAASETGDLREVA